MILAPSTLDLFAFGEDRLLELTEQHPTAFFAYDLDAARRRFRRLRALLPGRVRLAYAVKSNPGLPLLETFAAEGAWFDCASAGEVSAVLAAGGTGSGMVVAGPAKSERDLQAALFAGARIQVDGIEDVERLHTLHSGAQPLRVSVRVNPASGITETATIIGGGGPSAFGVDEEELDAFLAEAARYDRVRVTGLQVFAASNELDAGRLLDNHRTALRIGRHLHEAHGIDLDLIDVGGGLGVRYAAAQPNLDLRALGAGLERVLAENPWFGGELLLEPGRWLSAPTGVYCARVVRTKVSRGERFVMLEGGINHLLRPLMTGQSFPTLAVRPGVGVIGGRSASGQGGELVPTTLAGPLCTSLDRVGNGDLPEDLRPGDVVVFGQAGAYASTQAMTHFLSHRPPEQVWVQDRAVVSVAPVVSA
ncbi:diaminopimelate decarboxylase [Ornithinimicrobium humiphilum]|uniref:Diaminopimelate decarboxylase n=1 Tax=Ornithinimicrobium humiphilum TaxID=125288 RepID=A0A543K8A0_9MICO|nr:alanine racemase [Ornithinimicrobium humiphilum]TQM91300.1 diaminopimelate decarboxylase [Ornithinimicrobium humiphilum]